MKLGQRDTYCRTCRADYKQEHDAANRARYLENSTRRRQIVVRERMDYLLVFFATHPCVDCGETDSRVLEFDHRGDKLFNVGQGVQGRPWEQVLAEIDKCDVRCVNCHRRVTSRRGGFARSVLSESGKPEIPTPAA